MFELDKWYLDVVTPGGVAFIGYSGALDWHGLRLGYEAFLFHPPDAPPVERASFLRPHSPRRDGDRIAWSSPRLGANGLWVPAAARLRRRLLHSDGGSVVWLCLQPRSLARVRLAGVGTVEGVGYAERLRMTVSPGDLAMDTLHWGRFHGEAETIVWIEWQRGAAGRWIFRNGVEQPGAGLHERGVSGMVGGADLRFAELRYLRDRQVLPALAAVPGLRRRAAGRLAHMRERKWVGRGVRTLPGAPDVRGWLIHEEVTWRAEPESRAACSTAHSS